MADDRVLEAFEDCLARLQAGAGLEQVLARYPSWKQELRPMLLAAQAARQAGADMRVPQAAMARSRAKFSQKAKHLAAGRGRSAVHLPVWRLALASLLVVLVLASGLVTTVAVSAHALPGDVPVMLEHLSKPEEYTLAAEHIRTVAGTLNIPV